MPPLSAVGISGLQAGEDVNFMLLKQIRHPLLAQLIDHLFRELPWFTFDPHNQFHPDMIERIHGGGIIESDTHRQQ